MADLKNDIDKYLKGDLTPSEMHALEKKALSDPFLEDALEGAGQLTPDLLAEDLRSLHESLDNRIRKKDGKVVSIWVWSARIAAGLSLIAVATWLVVMLAGDGHQKELALNKDQKTPPAQESKQQAPIVADTADEEIAAESKPLEPQANQAKPEAPKPVAPASADQEANDESARTRDTGEPASNGTTTLSAEGASQPAVTSEKEEIPAPDELRSERKIAAAESSSSPAKAKRSMVPSASGYADMDKKTVTDSTAIPLMETAIAASRIIKGQVTAEDGTGLPGVNVMIKGTNIGTVADESGNYQIRLPQPDSELVFSYIGYSGKEVDVKDENEVNIQLQEDASQLSEIVVVGYGTERVGDEENNTSIVEFALPDGGRKAFKQYLEKNLRYPEQALLNKTEGKVTIQFNVETTGELSGFKIIRGIGNGCDEEVIRLIKHGPKWSATKKNTEAVKDRVKVRMRFALPGKRR